MPGFEAMPQPKPEVEEEEEKGLKKMRSWVKKLAEWDDGSRQGIELGVILGYQTA